MPTVLIIDDDRDSREALAGCLAKAGYTVRSAASGRDAIDALGDATPDAIFLDVRMPGIDGLAVLQVLRSYLRWATVPVAVLTAYPEDPRLWHVDALGVRRIFAKSRASMDELLAWVADSAGRAAPPPAPNVPPTHGLGA